MASLFVFLAIDILCISIHERFRPKYIDYAILANMQTIPYRTLRKLNHAAPDVLVWFALIIPFAYVPGDILSTRQLRLYLLLLGAVIAVVVPSTRKAMLVTISQLSTFARVALSIFGLGVLLSVVLSTFTKASFMGTQPEYIGLGMWLAAVTIGLAVASRLYRLLESPVLATLGACMLALSLLMDFSAVRYGIRLDGLALQASTMGILAAIFGVIALAQLRVKKGKLEQSIAITLYILSLTTLILTQSRMTTLAFCIVAILFLIWRQHRSQLSTMAAILGVVLSIGIPVAAPSYFSRYEAQDVADGSSYRMSLYRLTAKESVQKHLVYGGGGGTVPQSINDVYDAPPDIQQSLKQHVAFLSSHNMYLDVALSFGVIVALALVALTAHAFARLSFARDGWVLLAILLLVTTNALLNVPSLELTPFFFIVLFASLVYPVAKRRKSGAQ